MEKVQAKAGVWSWIARILGVLFVAVNGFGWWDEVQARQDPSGTPNQDVFWQWAILTHLLPLLLIVVGVIAGWTRPIFGAIAFGVFTLLQAISVGTEFIYLPLVVLPPLAIAVFFLLALFQQRKTKNS